jgi:hypothetical protein
MAFNKSVKPTAYEPTDCIEGTGHYWEIPPPGQGPAGLGIGETVGTCTLCGEQKIHQNVQERSDIRTATNRRAIKLDSDPDLKNVVIGTKSMGR